MKPLARRSLLQTLALSTALPWLAPALAQTPAPAAWGKVAFEAKSFADVLKALGATASESKDIALQVDEIPGNSSAVDIAVQSKIPATSEIAFIIDKNPNALAAVFQMLPGSDPAMSTKFKMAQSSKVFALVKAGDKYYYTSRDVRITIGGCVGNTEAAVAGNTTIRAKQQADATQVRMLVGHVMESGQRRDEAGKVIPAWYIQNISMTAAGKPVMQAQWGAAVARNPLLVFSFKGAKVGDKLQLNWADSRGEKKSSEAVVG
jgi:sulfur-oxidizing protein SoxY